MIKKLMVFFGVVAVILFFVSVMFWNNPVMLPAVASLFVVCLLIEIVLYISVYGLAL